MPSNAAVPVTCPEGNGCGSPLRPGAASDFGLADRPLDDELHDVFGEHRGTDGRDHDHTDDQGPVQRRQQRRADQPGERHRRGVTEMVDFRGTGVKLGMSLRPIVDPGCRATVQRRHPVMGVHSDREPDERYAEPDGDQRQTPGTAEE
jgi:hypothetical protein